MVAWLFVSLPTAQAGAGPWVVGAGQATVYVGAEAQRLTRLAITTDAQRDVIEVGEGVSSLGLKAIATIGLTPRVELQATVPWWRVQANRTDGQLCADLGLGACETTTSIGVIEVRGKGLVLDEFYGSPVSLAVGTELRSGDFTAATRERITNVGEGGLDVGLFSSLGRTGALARSGYWTMHLELAARYRFPLTRSYPALAGPRAVPGSEFVATTDALVGADRWAAAGPVATVLWRPIGVDWGDLDLTDIDRLGALRVFNLRVGGTILFRGTSNLSASITVLQTVAATNNPNDVLSVSAGIQWLIRRPIASPEEL